MEAPEVPLEQTQEHIKEHAERHGEAKRWILGVALSSAIFAALAAVASLQAGHHVNEALICQLQASDNWAHYQAKSIKKSILESEGAVLTALARSTSVAKEKGDEERNPERYAEEQKEIMAKAKELQAEGDHHLVQHNKLATAVTMFQICIAISAISVLTGRRAFWWVSLVFGGVGVYYVVGGIFG